MWAQVSFVLSQSTRQTARQTGRQTDWQKGLGNTVHCLVATCITCSRTVKIFPLQCISGNEKWTYSAFWHIFDKFAVLCYSCWARIYPNTRVLLMDDAACVELTDRIRRWRKRAARCWTDTAATTSTATDHQLRPSTDSLQSNMLLTTALPLDVPTLSDIHRYSSYSTLYVCRLDASSNATWYEKY